MAPDRFALLRTDDLPVEDLVERLKPLDRIGVSASAVRLPLNADTPNQNLRTLRYALDRYIEDGATAAQISFDAAMRRTLGDSARFKDITTKRAFHMAYQPVVRLGDETLHHFEALARFEADGSPADAIRLAEELGMIEDFDMAVAETVAAAVVAAPEPVRIAVNVSARSVAQQGFVERFLAATEATAKQRPRLLIEITETVALTDMEGADAAIQALRSAGHLVCIDDFGAGAASLDYIRHLHVDFLKIDGRYLLGLEGDPRAQIVIKHLIALCRELGVVTIAEMIETRQTARLARELGADLAQGWLFGKPQPKPSWTAPAPARRKDVVEQWA